MFVMASHCTDIVIFVGQGTSANIASQRNQTADRDPPASFRYHTRAVARILAMQSQENQPQASASNELAEIRGQVAAMQAQMAEVVSLRDQMAGMAMLMRDMSERLQSQAAPAPAPAQVVGESLPTPAAPVPSPNPVNPVAPVTPAPVAAGATLVTPATFVAVQTPPATQGAGQVSNFENSGGAFAYDLPGAETEGLFALPVKAKRDGEGTPEWKAAVEKLNEKFKAMEGSSQLDTWDIDELCLFPKVQVPPKFKVPDFVKYNGTTNPEHHLRSYCTRMGNWSRDENFLLAYFHESLTGPAYNWYMRLDRHSIKTWRDLVLAFKKHYRHNMKNAPTRDAVQALRKKATETFREYAERWRQAASEVQPPMLDEEMSTYFVKTLADPYYNYMIALPIEDFSQLIRVGERIDSASREGRISTSGDVKKAPLHFAGSKKSAGEVNLVQGSHTHSGANKGASSSASQVGVPPTQIRGGFSGQDYRSRPQKDERPLPNFGISRSELFKELVKVGVMAPYPSRPVNPPYPAWYKPELTCEYHMKAPGHSIETCDAFRRHVWNLLDAKAIAFEGAAGPSIQTNPLPGHGGGK